MNRPVSVISPTYSASAISSVGATPRPCIRSHTISAVQDASGSTRFTVPNRVLSWWWSMLTMCIPGSRNASAGLRSRLPQSRYTIVRSSMSPGGTARTLSSGRNSYSCGSGRSRSSMNAALSLPMASRISCIATSDPSASPSGFSCVTTISFCAERSSSRAWSRAERFPFSGITDLPVDQPRDAVRPLDRLVVLEHQRRRALEGQLGGDHALEETMGGTQPLERRCSGRLVAEDAHVHARMSQIWAGLDCSHCHKTDARILQILGDRVAEHSTHRLIDATHPLAGHPSPPGLKEAESRLS